jgi:DNA-binding CsgD family transcriptional regulator
MPKAKDSTWLHYFRNVSPSLQMPEEIKNRFVDHKVLLSPNFLSVFNHSVPLIYLLDYTSGKYISVSESTQTIIGFPASYMLDGGLEFTLEQYDKEHLRLFNEQIFPDRLQFLNTIPPSEHANYLFSYRFCLRNNKGEKVNLLQRNTFLSSGENGYPVMSIGIVVNVDHYCPSQPIIQVVEKIDSKSGLTPPELVFKRSYFLNDAEQLFSKREKEILLYMAEGLTSKEIAQKLFIAEGTVIIHRKHMMEKTGVLNVAALICFALRNGII